MAILMDWLLDCPHTDGYPLNLLQEAVERVTAQDGQVTAEDQERLEKAFKYYLETGQPPPRPSGFSTGDSAGVPPPPR